MTHTPKKKKKSIIYTDGCAYAVAMYWIHFYFVIFSTLKLLYIGKI